MSGEGRRAVIERWYDEAWHRGNLDVFDELYTLDWAGHFPQGLELRGPDSHKQFGRRSVRPSPTGASRSRRRWSPGTAW